MPSILEKWQWPRLVGRPEADYEFLNNYKILQTAFDKSGIKRYIDVNPALK
jgi:hypothetical protein